MQNYGGYKVNGVDGCNRSLLPRWYLNSNSVFGRLDFELFSADRSSVTAGRLSRYGESDAMRSRWPTSRGAESTAFLGRDRVKVKSMMITCLGSANRKYSHHLYACLGTANRKYSHRLHTLLGNAQSQMMQSRWRLTFQELLFWGSQWLGNQKVGPTGTRKSSHGPQAMSAAWEPPDFCFLHTELNSDSKNKFGLFEGFVFDYYSPSQDDREAFH